MLLRRRAPPFLAAVALLVGQNCVPRSNASEAKPAAPGALSDAIKAPRPKNGEWFGLYLVGQKVGYMYSDLRLDPADKSRVLSTQSFYFKATVGGKSSERTHTEYRTYEAKPNGKLISLTLENKGDGGDQTMEGTATSDGVHVIIRRPNQPNQVKNLPPSRETVEDADQERVALLRQKKVEGVIVDGMDLDTYKVWTTVEKPEERLLRGVKVKLNHVRTINEKENVGTDKYLTEAGELIEADLGPTMRAVAEPEAVAKKLDRVEIFALTQVRLPKQIRNPRNVPNSVTLLLSGLPPAFWKNDYRQRFKKEGKDEVEVTVTAAPPSHPKSVAFPLGDPAGGANLKDSMVMELDNPDIRAAARAAVGDEKDAYAAAKRVVYWVATHMENDYGASADRASDALRHMRGDCTEHSLLSVAMLRSLGIPAKRIDGLVYLENPNAPPAFYWHEWVEAYVGGEWTQLDPSFNEPVTDAAHLALGEETHEEIVQLIGQLKVVDVR